MCFEDSKPWVKATQQFLESPSFILVASHLALLSNNLSHLGRDIKLQALPWSPDMNYVPWTALKLPSNKSVTDHVTESAYLFITDTEVVNSTYADVSFQCKQF